jgi:hypothetical protein
VVAARAPVHSIQADRLVGPGLYTVQPAQSQRAPSGASSLVSTPWARQTFRPQRAHLTMQTEQTV